MSHYHQNFVVVKLLIPFYRLNNRVPDLELIEEGYTFHKLAFGETVLRVLQLELSSQGITPITLGRTSSFLEHWFLVEVPAPEKAYSIISGAIDRAGLSRWASFYLWDEREQIPRRVRTGIADFDNRPLDLDAIKADSESFEQAAAKMNNLVEGIASGELRSPFDMSDETP